MSWKIKRIECWYGWRSIFAVFVDERELVQFGQEYDGRWRVLETGDYFLTRRAARAAALKAAGVTPMPIVPTVFYDA